MKFTDLPHYIYYLKGIINKKISITNKIRALWWGIKIGRNITFSGKCLFYRYPNTNISIGNNCHFASNTKLNRIGLCRSCSITTMFSDFNASIEIADNCGFSGTVIGAFKSIKIGNNVKCGANTLITDGDWHLEDPRSGVPTEIIIEDNVWLGEGVKVLKGVTIGKNSLIGAGSIVTKSIPANVIAAGNPCRILKKIKTNNESYCINL